MEDHQSTKKRNIFLWLLYLAFMLTIFGVTTPFDFGWSWLDQDTNGGLSQGIRQMEQGNMKRRVGMVVLVAFSVVLMSQTRNRYRVNGLLGWALIFYLCWILLSLTWSVDPNYTMRRLVVVYMVYFSAIVAAGQFTLRELAVLAVFVTGSSLLMGIGNELRLGVLEPWSQAWRFSGIYHTVTMGWNCGLLVLSTMYLLTVEQRKRWRGILWTLLWTGIVFLVFTKTRTALSAAIVAISVYGYQLVSAKRKVFVFLGAIICLSATYMVIGDTLLTYGQQATTLGREGATETVGDLTGRVPLWKYGFKFAAERPLVGYGFSTFINKNSIDNILSSIGWAPSSMHSGYMNELMGTGAVGLGVLFSVLLLAFGRAQHLAKKRPEFLYIAAIVIWLSINLALETNLMIGMSFMTFLTVTLLVRLAFLPAEELQ